MSITKFNLYSILYFLLLFELLSTQTSDSCSCDFTKDSCDYLCCCDSDCPEEAIESWKSHSKCINKEDILEILSDRCIDINLLYKNNSRRGLSVYRSTEDVKGKENVSINNFCYSIDNSASMKTDLNSVDNIKKLGYKYDSTRIFKEYIEDYMINSFNYINKNQTNTSEFSEIDKSYDDPLKIDLNQSFYIRGDFYLYSGQYCQLNKKVSIIKAANYTCLMNKKDAPVLNDFKIGNVEKTCDNNTYYMVNKDTELIYHNNSTFSGEDLSHYTVLEVEFIIMLDETNRKVDKCFINTVLIDDDGLDKYKFKNSVLFIEPKNDYIETRKIPYRYSGKDGYIENLPLKTYIKGSDNKYYVPYDFYIVGKDKSGKCRIDSNIFDYLYLKDEDPSLLFGKDFSYICYFDTNDKYLTDSTLFKKIDSIEKVGRFGSSYFHSKNIKSDLEWVNVEKNKTKKMEGVDEGKIDMNIYVETKGSIYNPQKCIYRVIINYYNIDKKGIKNVVFNVKYTYLDINGDVATKETDSVSYPTIMPRIPPDLVSPLIESLVKK